MQDNPPPHQHTNRLSKESSPYLLQHAHNPVDWYPWGPEAFDRARKESKPIFLSVGYSTCYWCHVMERESFENEQIAAEMNQLFVNIKVDREQRPDVDQLYMTAVQVMTRHGGWPMSVWLTPELKPFYAGTYFPPSDQHGRPGLVTICRGVADAWKNRPAEVNKAADELMEILQRIAQPQPPEVSFTIDEAWVQRMIERSTGDYDPQHGGFGAAPKFPRQTLLRLLLVHRPSFPDAKRIEMLRHTLDAMAAGGIRDQLGGGFHRYSTDEQWLVPHFEIMLYDNAMLAWIYAEAFSQTNEQRYADVCRGILDFLLREMKSPDGAFYTAFDAEVDAMEGQSYLWTLEEVRDLLGEQDAEIFSRAYGLNEGPNFSDPHHGGPQPDKNVLFQSESTATIARSLNTDRAVIEQRLAEMRHKLLQVRNQRKQPSLDNKILRSWNALAIGALAHAANSLDDSNYRQAAITAAEYFLNHPQSAFLDDDAFMAEAMLELYHATGQQRWRDEAGKIASHMRQQFEDHRAGGFFFTPADAHELIVRQKLGGDSPLPSGNGAAARLLLALDQPETSAATLTVFAGQLRDNGESMSALVEAAHLYLRSRPPLKITAGSPVAAAISPEHSARDLVQVSARWIEADHFTVHVEIQPGYHINAHEPIAGLLPTELFIAGGIVENIDYPPAQSMQMAGQTFNGYAGPLDISVKMKESPNRSALRLELAYQICDDSSCMAAVRKPVPFDNANNPV